MVARVFARMRRATFTWRRARKHSQVLPRTGRPSMRRLVRGSRRRFFGTRMPDTCLRPFPCLAVPGISVNLDTRAQRAVGETLRK